LLKCLAVEESLELFADGSVARVFPERLDDLTCGGLLLGAGHTSFYG
jgi:hypothetical protein